jgi:nucleoside-diphosphate-sugar epimerase
MKVFVTGGAGFIGSNLISYLSKNAISVGYCDNSFSSIDNFFPNNAPKEASNISELTVDTLKKYDVLIHLAAVKKHNALIEEDLELLLKTNISSTVRLFKIAAKAGIKNIIFSSSLYANGNMKKFLVTEDETPYPLTLYGQSKLLAEHALNEVANEYGINATALRLYFIYGPRQYTGKGYPSVFLRTFERLKQGQPAIIVNDGLQRLDYLYVDDLCRLIHKVIQSPMGGFNIVNAASGNAYTIKSVISTISRLWSAKYGNVCDPIYEGQDFTYRTFRSGSYDIAKSAYQWTPSIDLELGISRMLDWYNSEQ